MENVTTELFRQIWDYEAELAKLQSELKDLTQSKADLQPDSSSATIASAIRQTAKDGAEKAIVVRGLKRRSLS